MSAPSFDNRRLSSEEFRDVIGHFASGVTVITTAARGKRYGTTASAVSSLSLEPPMVLICMNETSSTGQAIAGEGAFAMNILAENQTEVAKRFASKDPDKFVDGMVVEGPAGLPLLKDALASLECRVVEQVRGGTHLVFLAEVQTATARSGSPLAYFRGQFGRLALTSGEEAYAALRSRILAGDLSAGRQLDVGELASELGIAPGPLHVALGRLSAEGLVEQHGGEFRVPAITWEAVDDALSSRCTIELGVVEVTVGHVSASELARLRAALSAWTPVSTHGARVAWRDRHEQSMDFHDAMVSLAGSEGLLEAYRRLAIPSVLARAFSGYVLSERDEVFGEEHRALVEAYEANDAVSARAVVIRHTERIKAAARDAVPRSLDVSENAEE